jgi:hypothetical protein
MSSLVHGPISPDPAEAFQRTGLWRAEAPLPEDPLRFLQAESARLFGQIDVPRPWHYAELHNPWSRAAAAYDSWGFLDICQSSTLIEMITRVIGTDIVLFDSQWFPNHWESVDAEPALESDAHRFPVDPLHGLTALICFADTQPGAIRFDYRSSHQRTNYSRTGAPPNLKRGDVVLVDCGLPYHVLSARESNLPTVYAIRYFSASSRYIRDPSARMHRALTERYPLFNYARMPLWLVNGQDRGGNDFVTGFNVRAGFWTNAGW